MDSNVPILAVRSATLKDSPELARLFTELGYPTTAEDIVARWEQWAAAGNIALAAPKADGTLAGVATLQQSFVLHRPRRVGRITALVVDAALQKQGIGRALVAAAEETLREGGCGLVEVTSQHRFTDAHEFYKRLGYEQTSLRFSKTLASTG